ncbi:hypothetical protein DSK76_09225, partial [Mycobacterium tuberculosis]|uniref:hypothetical protein n=1 Tax=Mycobacterium tuberculosis TaxID=1773 RepID=UPI000E39D431
MASGAAVAAGAAIAEQPATSPTRSAVAAVAATGVGGTGGASALTIGNGSRPAGRRVDAMTDIEVALPFWLDRPDHEATDV